MTVANKNAVILSLSHTRVAGSVRSAAAVYDRRVAVAVPATVPFSGGPDELEKILGESYIITNHEI